MSVFAAGLLRGISCIIVCVLCWDELQQLTLLLQVQFVLVWYSIFAKSLSLAILSAIKSLSVLKPFFYMQRVTRTRMLIITLLIWFLSLVSAVPMILPVGIGFSDVVQIPSPGSNGDQLFNLLAVFVYPFVLYAISRCVIFISSIILLTVTVKHKLQIKREKAELADEVVRAIWSSKGVLAISIVSIILNLPTMAVTNVPQHLAKQELRFYFYWLSASDIFFYSLCVIFTSPTLLNWIKSGGRVKVNPLELQ